MFNRRYVLILALAAILLSPASYAAEPWIIKRTSYYIALQQQQRLELQPSPAPGSAADMADLAAVREWQEKRTKDQCARAKAELHADYAELFGDISPFPKPLPVPARQILARVKKETDSVVATVKDKYKRLRPFERDTSLAPCLGRIGGLTYPSGHATIARIYALILSDLVPERRAKFMARADEAALNRVIGGVHHPTDIEAGKKLADIIYPMYLKSPAFQANMKTLRGCMLRAPAVSAK